jgi:ribosomal protein S12 methylthiotransferase
LKTKSNIFGKVNVVTLGCAKNQVDSEVLVTQLKANGIDTHHEAENASDIVIVNTCGFIETAKEESIDTILRFAEEKKRGNIKKLYVTGCLSQRYREDLEREIADVDAWFGTMELPLLLRRFNADYRHELVGEKRSSLARHFAYMKISEGCDRPCSFCAIPLMRGKHVSRPMGELVQEAKSQVRQGVKEILIIAQDSTYYGLDLYQERKLAELLMRLSDVDGLEWIRLHYAFPSGFPLEVLDVMAERSNICNYLDIPLQHASDKMLRIMRRGITRVKTEALIGEMRARVPEIALRTTMIVGHPGEEEDDFEELLDFCATSKFDRLGVFTYSHEENTHAFDMDDSIPNAVKQARLERIMELQQEVSLELNRKKIGREYKILIDRKEGNSYYGRTEYDSPEVDNEVLVDAEKFFLRTGDFVHARITDASEFDLYAEPVQKNT